MWHESERQISAGQGGLAQARILSWAAFKADARRAFWAGGWSKSSRTYGDICEAGAPVAAYWQGSGPLVGHAGRIVPAGREGQQVIRSLMRRPLRRSSELIRSKMACGWAQWQRGGGM